MFSFSLYALLSLFLTVSALFHAFHTRHQFYPSVLFLTQAKFNLLILSNLGFFLLLCFGRLIKWIFLGSLSREEMEDLFQNAKYAVTETGLALTIFREEIHSTSLALFTALLFVKSFHWLLAIRVENLGRSHQIPLSIHIRLFSLLFALGLADCLFVYLLGANILANRTPSVLLLFGFEFLILAINVWSTLCKYIVFLVDQRLEGRWNSKNTWVFALEFSADLARLFLYLVFFTLICHYYGLPIHLIRELFMTFYTVRERVVKFIHYRRMTANMNERFPNSTRAELEAADDVCIICREEMMEGTAKKLPRCSHHFHTHCLRSWLERSSTCPTCRAEIQNNNRNQQQQAQPAQQQQPQPAQAGAIGAAAVEAALAQLPPLPPRLQAHLSQAQRNQPTPAENTTEAQSGSSSSVSEVEEKKSSSVSSASADIPAPFARPTSIPSTAHLELPTPALVHSLDSLSIPSSSTLSPSLYLPYSLGSPLIPGSSLPLNPLDPLHLSLFHHHTLLLQHQIEFLSSALNQAKILFERQIEFQEKLNQLRKNEIEKENKGKSEEKTEKAEDQAKEKESESRDSASGSSLSNVTVEDDSESEPESDSLRRRHRQSQTTVLAES